MAGVPGSRPANRRVTVDRAHQAVQGVLSTLASDDPTVRIAYLLDLPEPEDVVGA